MYHNTTNDKGCTVETYCFQVLSSLNHQPDESFNNFSIFSFRRFRRFIGTMFIACRQLTPTRPMVITGKRTNGAWEPAREHRRSSGLQRLHTVRNRFSNADESFPAYDSCLFSKRCYVRQNRLLRSNFQKSSLLTCLFYEMKPTKPALHSNICAPAGRSVTRHCRKFAKIRQYYESSEFRHGA